LNDLTLGNWMLYCRTRFTSWLWLKCRSINIGYIWSQISRNVLYIQFNFYFRLGVSGLRAKNEYEDCRMANPLTILVPHLDLDIGSLLPFQTIIQGLD